MYDRHASLELLWVWNMECGVGKRWHVELRGESCMQWLGELNGSCRELPRSYMLGLVM